jgi:ubiquinone biosynthesis protein UbiJ
MATQSPFSLLDDVFNQLTTRFQPPAWAITEAQRKLVILLNHVLMQEREAMARLMRQKGRVVQFEWRHISLRLRITPAGLLDVDDSADKPDLSLAITELSPSTLVQQAMAGDKPAVRIEGDVQLAAEINWLSQHVRWDMEDDLARLIGDAPASMLAKAARAVGAAAQQFIGQRRGARA